MTNAERDSRWTRAVSLALGQQMIKHIAAGAYPSTEALLQQAEKFIRIGSYRP